jgi:predicted glycosyltransferase
MVMRATQRKLETTIPRKNASQSVHSRSTAGLKKIWIDLDNSPHVPFFIPIVQELRDRGYQVVLTARNSYQVCDLLSFHHISCKVVGKHWGKNRALKVLGTCLRALRLMSAVALEKPDLAVSHGSRSQILCAALLRVPTLLLYDYEHTAQTGFLRPDWVMAPSFVPKPQESRAKNPELRYPGLKEEVYVDRFRPDPSLKKHLGLAAGDLVVTVRPPATEAHYHNEESEALFGASMSRLVEQPGVRVILLPRNLKQADFLREQWKDSIDKRKVVIPHEVVDGLNLIWFSDLVISGGGTMNREAAALGVPVYSIFRGRIGAVDHYLAEQGRLTLIQNVEEVRTKIALVARHRATSPRQDDCPALQTIVDGIAKILDARGPSVIRVDSDEQRV